MHRPVMRDSFTVAMLASIFAPIAVAQHSIQDVMDSLRAQQVPDVLSADAFRAMELRYTVDVLIDTSDARISELRRTVEGRPDHPSRKDLQIALRAKEFGGVRYSNRLFVYGPNQWRRSETSESEGSLKFWDTAVDGKDSWQLTAETLSLVNTTQSVSGAPSPWETTAAFTFPLKHAFGGGLGTISPAPQGAATIRTDGFTIDLVPRDGVVVRVEGRWEDPGIGARISRTTVVSAESEPAIIGLRRTFGPPLFLDSVGRWAYSQVTTTGVPGRRDEKLTITEVVAAPYPASDVLAGPSVGRDDFVRGLLRVDRIVDARSGSVVETLLTSVPNSIATSPPRRGARPEAVIAWCLSIALVSAIALYVRRRSGRIVRVG